MMKKAYKLTFQNGKSRIIEDDASLDHLRAACLGRYLSDGSGGLCLCKAVEEVLDRQMALRMLDEMDALRRKHWYQMPPPCDYYLRAMEAIVARAAGYESRTDWTDCLKSDAESQYCRDLKDPELSMEGDRMGRSPSLFGGKRFYDNQDYIDPRRPGADDPISASRR